MVHLCNVLTLTIRLPSQVLHGPVQNGLADMTSTFRFTASARVNGTVVQCIESTATGIQRANNTLIVAGLLHM